jgi:signal transduction histidine kinase
MVVAGASAGALYVAAYTGALGMSAGDRDLGAVLLAGLANTLPDVLAAPLVLRASARHARRGTGRLPLLAAAFVAWGVLGTSLAFGTIRLLRGSPFTPGTDVRVLAWKALLSLLVFGVLAGAGRARHHADAAREAEARALRAEALRAESRLAVLRAQLEPHFILNVLHSLVGLAERDPRATSVALERLGTTLRYAQRVLRRGSDRVALRDELDFTREYLELERLRLGERLTTRFQIDDALLGRVVPAFVLQPLVENAVRHAVAPRAEGGLVSVLVDEEAGALRLCVEDDGSAGEEASAAARVLAAGPGSGPPSGTGLGLRLLRDRLEALYGGGGTLGLDRSPLGGLRALVSLRGEPWAPGEVDPG